MNHFNTKPVRGDWDGRWGASWAAPCLRDEPEFVIHDRLEQNRGDENHNARMTKQDDGSSLAEAIALIIITAGQIIYVLLNK